jgi:hypothetical protein
MDTGTGNTTACIELERAISVFSPQVMLFAGGRKAPGTAALCVDSSTPHGLILYSPYSSASARPRTPSTERPHYLANFESDQLHRALSDAIAHATFPDLLIGSHGADNLTSWLPCALTS